MRHRAFTVMGPLPFPVALELVKPDALQRAQVVQGLGDIEGQQQVHGTVEVQATELVRPLTFPHLAAGGVAPRPDHGKNVLRETGNCKAAGEMVVTTTSPAYGRSKYRG